MNDCVDGFAGPGGWDVAARELGLNPVGIEFDAAACATRRAAGLDTVEGDIRHYGPADFPSARGLIMSPPCQTFSAAGHGAGRRNLHLVLELLHGLALGLPPDYSRLSDERTGLVLEPLRWALEGDYDWIALEQVPAVLPVWQAMATVLRDEGYSVATGILRAEQFGVPQTRKRAILVARRLGEAKLPMPTHSRYHSHDRTRLDPHLLPWVSMAKALGQGMTERPYPTIASSRSTGRPDKEKVEGPGARAQIYAELATGRWQLASGTRAKAAIRALHEPSPTLAFGHDVNSYVWTPHGTTPEGVVEHKANGTSVRLSIEEAAVLQSLPGHPWHGTDTKRFQQIGNMIPPLLARAVLLAALGLGDLL